MKPFNLEEYLANPSRKVVTRDGRSARIICTEAKGNYPVVALVLNEGGEVPESYNKKGTYLNSNKSDNDLFFAPEKGEGWVNIYKIPDTYQLEVSCIFSTKNEAEFHSVDNPNYVATTKITWEE